MVRFSFVRQEKRSTPDESQRILFNRPECQGPENAEKSGEKFPDVLKMCWKPSDKHVEIDKFGSEHQE